MEDYEGSAMIALLPTSNDWSKLDLPHLTLVYAGETADLQVNDFNRLAKDAASIAMLAKPLTLKVTGQDVFGDEEKVDVYRLMPTPELLAMRNMVEEWNASEYPFRPHVTIGPIGSAPAVPPMYLTFDRITVGWGKEYLTFWLKY